MKVTQQQQALLNYLEKHQQAQGMMPSQREIQEHFGFASRNSVPKHLAALEKKGLLRRTTHLARSMSLPHSPPITSLLTVPLLGAIPAGYSETVEERKGPSITINPEMLSRSNTSSGYTRSLFALTVRGDSMIDAGILDGDIVILEQKEAHPGDIVAALIDGESTLKRLIKDEKEKGGFFLKAENKNYPNLFPIDELTIQGVFCALWRS